MLKLYPYQEKTIDELTKPDKHFVICGTGSGKGAIMLHWLKATNKTKWLAVVTASKRDSCFPAGTLVQTLKGKRPIETVQAGDLVYAFNGEHVVLQPVARTLSIETDEDLYRFVLQGDRELIATENHPIYIGNGGYLKAKELKVGDTVYELSSATTARGGDEKISIAEPRTEMHLVQDSNARANESAARPMATATYDVLQSNMFETGSSRRDSKGERARFSSAFPKRGGVFPVRQEVSTNNSDNASDLPQKQEAVLWGEMCNEGKRDGAFDFSERPSETARNNNEGCSLQGSDLCQKQYSNTSSANIPAPNARWGTRVCHPDCTELRTDRPSLPLDNASYRDRREATSRQAEAGGRRTEGLGIKPVRVERIEVLRRQPEGTHTVYCLTVGGTHNFFANGILVHNCDVESEAEAWFGEEYMQGIHLEVISWHGLAKWVIAHWAELTDWAFALDEIHLGKAGVSSARGRAFIQIAKQTECWTGYTATPGDRWEDFQAYFVACGLVKNKTTFMREFCDIQTYKGFPEIVGYRSVNILKAYWQRIAVFPDTQAMLDELPEEQHKTVHFKPDPAYKRFLKDQITPDGEFCETVMKFCHTCRQLCFTKAKAQWVADYLENLGTNTVLFYNYVIEGDEIEKIAKKVLPKGAKIWRIDGKHHDVPTEDKMGKYDIVLAQYTSGSASLNLQFLNEMVLVSPNYSYTVSVQARGRIKRIGQKKLMVFHYLLTDDTIENDVYRCLRNKSDFATDVWCEQKGLKLKGDSTM